MDGGDVLDLVQSATQTERLPVNHGVIIDIEEAPIPWDVTVLLVDHLAMLGRWIPDIVNVTDVAFTCKAHLISMTCH